MFIRITKPDGSTEVVTSFQGTLQPLESLYVMETVSTDRHQRKPAFSVTGHGISSAVANRLSGGWYHYKIEVTGTSVLAVQEAVNTLREMVMAVNAGREVPDVTRLGEGASRTWLDRLMCTIFPFLN